MNISPLMQIIEVSCALKFCFCLYTCKKNKFLITQRPPNKSYPLFWEFPGGKVEKKESFHAAAIRELKEELNINVNQSNLILIDTVSHSYVKNHIIMMHVFLVKQWKNKIRANEKQKMLWVNQKDFKKINFLKGSELILERIKSNFYRFYL